MLGGEGSNVGLWKKPPDKLWNMGKGEVFLWRSSKGFKMTEYVVAALPIKEEFVPFEIDCGIFRVHM